MNREQKQAFADYLFDEIGLIDERYIAEAASVYRPRRRIAPRRVLVIAATLALMLTVTLALLIGNDLIGSKNAAKDNALEEWGDHSSSTSAPTLSLRLESLKSETEHLRMEATEIDLFDGQCRIIWQYADEEVYRVRSITSAQKDTLLLLMSKNAGTELPADDASTPRALTGIWIALGDGTLISPCLEQTPGNVGYGSIFSYTPELEPSTAFTDKLCGILS